MSSNLDSPRADASGGDSGKTPSFIGIPLSSDGLEHFMTGLANATHKDINLAALTNSILALVSGRQPNDH